MATSIAEIKKLREETSVGIADAKKALEATGGDFEKSKEWLRKKGLVKAQEKADREAKEGYVGSYIHQTGKLGVIVAIQCETDFVARTDDFKNFAKDIAMHIAAFNPLYVSSDEIDPNTLEKVKEELKEATEGLKKKPANIQEQILNGKLEKYFSEVCLLNQSFIRNEDITVGELVGEMVGKLGENIKITRFSRIQIG